VFGFRASYEVASLVPIVRAATTDAAVGLASQVAILGMKLFLFAFLVYAFLLKPHAPGVAIRRLVPPGYHDVVSRYHERIRDTLYAIYVLQAATAFGTFVIGWIVFALLGYDAAFSIAVIAGILQFVPIVGPSLVVSVVAVVEVVGGDVGAAVLVTASASRSSASSPTRSSDRSSLPTPRACRRPSTSSASRVASSRSASSASSSARSWSSSSRKPSSCSPPTTARCTNGGPTRRWLHPRRPAEPSALATSW